mgnify:CR=1 FL=1
MKSVPTQWSGPDGFDSPPARSIELPDTAAAATPLEGVDVGLGAGIGLLILGLYLVTLAPTVLEADAGEFQFVPWLPGLAHPTGYPLYTLLGWLWTHLLPLGEVAWRMNLLSAILAGLAVAVVYLLDRQLLQQALPLTGAAPQRIVAALTALTFAVTPTFWSQALVAEVYALHLLLVATALWLALRFDGLSFNATRWLALVVGLGLTHHVTMVLLVPGLVVALGLRYLDRTVPQTNQPLSPPKILAQHLVLLLAPLLLYAYLPLIAGVTPYATLQISPAQQLVLYDNSPGGFWRHVTATVFSSDLQPTAVGLERLRLAGELLYQQVGGLGIGLAIAGLAVLWQRRKWTVLALTGLTAIAITGFNLIYFIGDVFVLFIPVWLLVCLWAGTGLLGLIHWLATRFVRGKVGPDSVVALQRLRRRLRHHAYHRVVTGLSAIFLAWPVTLLLGNLPLVDQAQNWAAGLRWQQILAEPLPDSAILLSNDRNEIMPMWYYQYVEHRRPDLQGLFPLITPAPEVENVGRLLDYALASTRPVYLIKPMPGLDLKANLTPEGTLIRATPLTATIPRNVDRPLPSIQLPGGASESITLAGYEVTAGPVEQQIELTLYWQVTQPLSLDYTSYVHLIDPTGHRLTQSDQRPGGEYYPSRLWQAGELLRDRHRLFLPADLTNLAGADLRVQVGLYHQSEAGQIQGMGDGLDLGPLRIEEQLP